MVSGTCDRSVFLHVLVYELGSSCLYEKYSYRTVSQVVFQIVVMRLYMCACRGMHVYVCARHDMHVYVCARHDMHVYVCACRGMHVYVCACCGMHVYVCARRGMHVDTRGQLVGLFSPLTTWGKL